MNNQIMKVFVKNPLFQKSIFQKTGSIQYNAAFSITVIIRGTSQLKLYNELGFVKTMN